MTKDGLIFKANSLKQGRLQALTRQQLQAQATQNRERRWGSPIVMVRLPARPNGRRQCVGQLLMLQPPSSRFKIRLGPGIIPIRIWNLLIVAFARNGTVIPHGEFLIEPDFHRLAVFIGVALLKRIVTGENMDGCFQALFCARPCHGLAGHLS